LHISICKYLIFNCSSVRIFDFFPSIREGNRRREATKNTKHRLSFPSRLFIIAAVHSKRKNSSKV